MRRFLIATAFMLASCNQTAGTTGSAIADRADSVALQACRVAVVGAEGFAAYRSAGGVLDPQSAAQASAALLAAKVACSVPAGVGGQQAEAWATVIARLTAAQVALAPARPLAQTVLP